MSGRSARSKARACARESILLRGAAKVSLAESPRFTLCLGSLAWGSTEESGAVNGENAGSKGKVLGGGADGDPHVCWGGELGWDAAPGWGLGGSCIA